MTPKRRRISFISWWCNPFNLLLSPFQVSWVRHRDIHLLTVGRYTYTSDQRFEAMHSPHTEEWTLRIRYAQRKDSGIYECQISTTPPIGHFVYLTVVGESTMQLSSSSSCVTTQVWGWSSSYTATCNIVEGTKQKAHCQRNQFCFPVEMLLS